MMMMMMMGFFTYNIANLIHFLQGFKDVERAVAFVGQIT
jgi:hypothetical protein